MSDIEDETPDGAPDAEDEKHERSSIAFPYVALDAAEEVARAIWERHSTGACPVEELAAQMNQVLSGAFRVKTAAARTFGLVDKDGRSAFRLTELGRRLVQPGGEKAARVDAFLAVPLYARIYENHKGHLLPPPKALEAEIHSLGVSSKQTDRARQAFDRSARIAGFFEAGENRLVKPLIKATDAPGDDAVPVAAARATAAPTQHADEDKLALIKMLVARLPDELTNEKLAQWLRAAEVNLRWSHNVDGEINIDVVKPDER